nr:MAG TPA: translation initiation factor-like protein [Caudoviricetes sp.]DAM49392.1 MAG TPA: translation initiation factor-like protein [Caudoviricetes sp.]
MKETIVDEMTEEEKRMFAEMATNILKEVRLNYLVRRLIIFSECYYF